MIVDEQEGSFHFDCGWGVDPPVACVPLVEQWSVCVPEWLRDRRDEVIAAMKAVNHVILECRYPEPR
jgi:hypothetical protein